MYNYVFITHLPSFYKVNLYNSIAKNANIFVIFISSGSKDRTSDFIKKDILFNYKIISHGNFESRFRLFSLFSIYFLLRSLKYQKIVVSGWELIEFWLIILLNKKEKNCLCLESTIIGTNMNLPYYILKRLFISKINIVFASGSLHSKIPEKLRHKGKTLITNGVGIIEKTNYLKNYKTFEYKFLFVGRLAPEKNLQTN
jgi:glycosyltransferase involved in cell wall biosynthesis